MKDQLQGWAEENKDKVSFCPMCRTKIEKNAGCNHMTCYLCGYEFCWACGGSASGSENHFNGRGCGVKQMDENVKPGDGKLQAEEDDPRNIAPICFALKWIGLYILLVVSFPLLVVFFFPVKFAIESGRKCYTENGRNPLAAVLGFLAGFLFMMIVNVMCAPILAIYGLMWIVFGPFIGLAWLCKGCKVPDNGYTARKEARARNA